MAMNSRRSSLLPAASLATVRTPHVTVLVDYRTGEMVMLTGDALTMWLAHLAGDSDPLRELTPDNVTAVTRQFVERRWLVDCARRPARTARAVEAAAVSWGTQEIPAQLNPPGPSPWRWRLAGFAAVLVTLLARQLGSRRGRFSRLVYLALLGRWLPPASTRQARHAVRAVRWAARFVPARVACLEESVSAALLLAVTGRRAGWCHGIAVDPIRLHAWIADSAGHPIEEPTDTDRYTPIGPDPADRRKGGRS